MLLWSHGVLFISPRSVYDLMMLAVPHLIKTKGCIVNVSSVCGMRSVSTNKFRVMVLEFWFNILDLVFCVFLLRILVKGFVFV